MEKKIFSLCGWSLYQISPPTLSPMCKRQTLCFRPHSLQRRTRRSWKRNAILAGKTVTTELTAFFFIDEKTTLPSCRFSQFISTWPTNKSWRNNLNVKIAIWFFLLFTSWTGMNVTRVGLHLILTASVIIHSSATVNLEQTEKIFFNPWNISLFSHIQQVFHTTSLKNDRF